MYEVSILPQDTMHRLFILMRKKLEIARAFDEIV